MPAASERRADPAEAAREAARRGAFDMLDRRGFEHAVPTIALAMALEVAGDHDVYPEYEATLESVADDAERILLDVVAFFIRNRGASPRDLGVQEPDCVDARA